MSSFIYGAIAVAIDASNSYCDKIMALKSSGFTHATQPCVFRRLDRLFENLELITTLESVQSPSFTEEHKPMYIQERTSRIRYTGKPITIRAITDIYSQDRYVIRIVHVPTNGSDTFLSSMVTADVFAVDHAYVINTFDGSMYRIKLKNGDTWSEFMEASLVAKLSTEVLLGDVEFTRLHSLSEDAMKLASSMRQQRLYMLGITDVYDDFDVVMSTALGGTVDNHLATTLEEETEDEEEEHM